MTQRPSIQVDLAFDRYLLEDDSLEELATGLARLAPSWMSAAHLNYTEPDATPIPSATSDFESAYRAAATRPGPTYFAVVEQAKAGGLPVHVRTIGSAELGVGGGEFSVYIDVDENPLATIAKRLTLRNHVGIDVSATTVEGQPANDWSWLAFRELADRLRPAWGALYAPDEYRAKVMVDRPRVEAIGRDFASYLPGLFAGNYYGPRYVELFGREVLLSVTGARSEPLGDGVLLVVSAEANRWREPEVQARAERVANELGHEFFYDKRGRRPRTTAPKWR